MGGFRFMYAFILSFGTYDVNGFPTIPGRQKRRRSFWEQRRCDDLILFLCRQIDLDGQIVQLLVYAGICNSSAFTCIKSVTVTDPSAE